MKTIKRYDLSIEAEQTIDIPFNSEILRFGTPDNKPSIYVLVESGQREMKRKLVIFAEGKEVPAKYNRTNYLGAFEYRAEVGSNVLHVFED